MDMIKKESLSENETTMDPDYAPYNSAVKRAEAEKSKDCSSVVETIKQVINDEFNKELQYRQSQIEDIEKRINKTQKLLHLLRYVLVTSYYNKKELEYNGDEESSTTDANSLFEQVRMHPAVKKLIGKSPKVMVDLSPGRSKRSGKIGDKSSFSVQGIDGLSTQLKTPEETEIVAQNENTISGISNLNTEHCNNESDRNRQKIKHRIIVGNISKWMPSNENDLLTHKWMMYVRGPKDSPDVSHFIDRVKFYLHPSYKPHDVVEVSSPPFHLSRRGWGEFPIRVQIFFKCILNKPVDIVHNLKLDKTYTGRQTLGNESIVDLYLHSENNDVNEEEQEVNSELPQIQDIEFIDIESGLSKFEFFDESSGVNDEMTIQDLKDVKFDISELQVDTVIPTTSFEHDYCYAQPSTPNVNMKVTEEEIETESVITSDHSYSHPSSREFSNIKIEPLDPDFSMQPENKLIYGLGDWYSQPDEDLRKKEPLFYRKTQIFTPKVKPVVKNLLGNSLTTNVKTYTFKRKSQESLLKKVFTNKLSEHLDAAASGSSKAAEPNITIGEMPPIDYKEFRIVLPKNKFKNCGETLPFLFKRLPLYSELTNRLNYKCTYPFVATSLEDFKSWSVGKRASSEWSRAKLIRNILCKEKIFGYDKWNTKAVLMYGKSHGYTPARSYDNFGKKSSEEEVITGCFNSSGPPPSHSQYEHSVDVENEDEPQAKKQKLAVRNISDRKLKMECAYVRQEALECGVVLKNEVIGKGMEFNGSERMILSAVQCLANHLVRRALHHKICGGNFRANVSEIQSVDVEEAMEERLELNALVEFTNNQRNRAYYM